MGVGYKAKAGANKRLLFLKLWYNLEVELIVPPVVSVFYLKKNVVCCIGIDKQRVHQFVVTVKLLEVYKGKWYNVCWQSYQEAREIKWLQRG